MASTTTATMAATINTLVTISRSMDRSSALVVATLTSASPARRDADRVGLDRRLAYAKDPAHDHGRRHEQQDERDGDVDDLLLHPGLEPHLRGPGAHDPDEQGGGDGGQRLDAGEQR